jgi:hypothetical protein
MNGFIATHLNKHTNTGPHCRPTLKEMKPTNTKASTGYLILRTTITNQPLSIHFKPQWHPQLCFQWKQEMVQVL